MPSGRVVGGALDLLAGRQLRLGLLQRFFERIHLGDGVALERGGGDSHDYPLVMALMRELKMVCEAWIICAQAW